MNRLKFSMTYGFVLVVGLSVFAAKDAAAQQGYGTQNGQQYAAQQTAQQGQAQPGQPAGYTQPVYQQQNVAGQTGRVQATPASSKNTIQQPAGGTAQQQIQEAPGQPPVQVISAEQAVKEGIAKVAQQPFPALNAAQNQYLDAVLNVWEQRTAEVEQYQCQFKRWQFDPGVHATAAASIAEGELRFMDPDKGFFKVTTTKDVVGRAPEPEYKVNPKRPHGEHWICDGEWVHILDANAQKAVRIQLPPQMRGKQIHLSPLPFLFGVKAEEIKQRYWIRPIASPPGDDSVWLEAWPKRGDDAGAYSRVQVILSRKDSLPRGLIVYMPNWRPEQPHREVYEFTDRKTGASILQVLKQNVFMQAFIPTELPADWQVIEKPYVPPQQQQNVANPNAPNGAAPQVR